MKINIQIIQQRRAGVSAQLTASVLFLSLTAGCAADESAGDVAPVRSALTAQDASVVQLYRVKPEVEDITERIAKVLAILTGKDGYSVGESDFVDSDGIHFWNNVSGSGLHAIYDPAEDDLEVKDFAAMRDYVGLMAEPFLPEDQARVPFMETLKKLEDSGLVQVGTLDLENVRVGNTEIGQGRNDEEPSREVIQYKFKVRRVLDGGPIKNSLVRVGVSRRGQVVSVRLFRMAIQLESAGSAPREVDDATCTSRFVAEFPNAVITQQGVGYFVPRSIVGGEVIAPRCWYSYAEESFVDGRTVIARRKEARYSTLDAAAVVEVFGGAQVNESK